MLARCAHGADAFHVVVAKHRGRRLPKCEELRHSAHAALGPAIAVSHKLGPETDAGFVQDLPVAGQALRIGLETELVADVGDTAVAEIHEMPHGLPRAMEI